MQQYQYFTAPRFKQPLPVYALRTYVNGLICFETPLLCLSEHSPIYPALLGPFISSYLYGRNHLACCYIWSCLSCTDIFTDGTVIFEEDTAIICEFLHNPFHHHICAFHNFAFYVFQGDNLFAKYQFSLNTFNLSFQMISSYHVCTSLLLSCRIYS